MVVQRAIDAVDRRSEPWLTPVERVLERVVTGAFAKTGTVGARAKDFLNGVWLEHPLHPALTDVPVGAWTTAIVLDLMESTTGRRELGAGADGAVALGLVGALGAAVTGLADWQYLAGRTRQTATIHGLLNVGAVLLYSTSLLLRRSGARGAGRVTGALGYGTVLVSAYLGGDLVYRDLANVNHANTEFMPRRYVKVMPEADLPEGKLTRVLARDTPVVLLRRGDRIFALAERCSHLGGPLAEGTLQDDRVTCPWHGSCFAFEDGHILNGPATNPQPVFETRVRDGQIEVRLAKQA